MKIAIGALLTLTLFIFACTSDDEVQKPEAPSNLEAIVVSNSQIDLTWTDNSNNESGFKIERKSGTDDYALIATLQADLTSFNDTGLLENISYTYRVYSYNSTGKSLSFSNEVTATTDELAVPVADGFYISITSEKPTEHQVLNPEVVELNFGTQVRDGYYSNYIYLSAGNYNLLKIKDQEILSTYGGPVAEIDSDSEKSDCANYNVYTLMDQVALNGPSFNIPSSGLYYVGYDVTATELFYYKIEVANVIGSATAAGWSHSDGQIMLPDGVITADGATFKITNQILRPGSWKVRFNCRWKIDRRNNTSNMANPAFGYNALLHLGGQLNYPQTGGANFELPEGGDSKNTIEAKWTPDGGWTLVVTKTADLEPIGFVPEEYQWSIVGDATSVGWPVNNTCGAAAEDIDFNYSGYIAGTNTYSWQTAGAIAINATGDFKFRTNHCWDYNLTYNGVAVISGDGAADMSSRNGNFGCSVSAFYIITITTNDDGESWSVDFNKQ